MSKVTWLVRVYDENNQQVGPTWEREGAIKPTRWARAQHKDYPDYTFTYERTDGLPDRKTPLPTMIRLKDRKAVRQTKDGPSYRAIYRALQETTCVKCKSVIAEGHCFTKSLWRGRGKTGRIEKFCRTCHPYEEDIDPIMAAYLAENEGQSK